MPLFFQSATHRFCGRGEKEYLLADGRTGLFLRVLPSGGKSWIYRYTLADGRRRKIAIGSYPSLSLADARSKHADLVKIVTSGQDPTAPIEIITGQTTVEDLATQYLYSLEKLSDKEKLSKKTYAESNRTLKKYVLPVLGSRPVREVRRPDAIALIERYVDTPGQARAVMKIARAMFSWGLVRAHVDFNPFSHVVSAVPAIKAQQRTRALNADEIKHIWQALVAEKDPRSLSTRRALLMILVTGQRPEEVTGSSFEEISVGIKGEQRCEVCRRCGWWTIPWKRIKTSNSRKENHRVYLTALALNIISDGQQGGPVFPNSRGTSLARHSLSHYVNDYKCWGLEKWTPHDLRRTAATGLSKLGCSDEIIDAILNHAKQGVIGIYNRNKYDNEKEKWLNIWSAHLEALIAPPV